MLCNPKHDFISPLKSVGTVVVNGRVSRPLIMKACSNRNPYYSKADGSFENCLSDVGRGDIVYHFHTREDSLECSTIDPLFNRAENCRISGATVLNGQGDALQSNIEFMNSVQVLGIAEMPKVSNGTDLFNIVVGGIHDVKNNGNETINVGDWVMAHAPSREEARRGSGNNQNAAEKAGVVKLWYKPYKPELHKKHIKQIYQCLIDTNNARGCHPSYKRQCTQFYDSAVGMAAVLVAKLAPELRAAFASPNADTASIMESFLTQAGHSKFRAGSLTSAEQARRDEVRDALFVPHCVNNKNVVQYLFPREVAGLTKRQKDLNAKLNTIQAESTSLFLEASAAFTNQFNNQIIGQAKSTARPGMDFSLQLANYSKR